MGNAHSSAGVFVGTVLASIGAAVVTFGASIPVGFAVGGVALATTVVHEANGNRGTVEDFEKGCDLASRIGDAASMAVQLFDSENSTIDISFDALNITKNSNYSQAAENITKDSNCPHVTENSNQTIMIPTPEQSDSHLPGTIEKMTLRTLTSAAVPKAGKVYKIFDIYNCVKRVSKTKAGEYIKKIVIESTPGPHRYTPKETPEGMNTVDECISLILKTGGLVDPTVAMAGRIYDLGKTTKKFLDSPAGAATKKFICEVVGARPGSRKKTRLYYYNSF